MVLVVLLGEWGCDHDTTPTQTGGTPHHVALSVTISLNSDTLMQGNSLPLRATIAGWTTDSTVSWSLIGVGVAPGAPASQVGWLTDTGLHATYIAPAVAAGTTLFVRIRVRANQDTDDYVDCNVTVVNKAGSGRVSVLVNPTAVSLAPGQGEQFQATVTGSTNTGVRWKLVSGPGTISPSGWYATPSYLTDSSASAIVEAIALADSTAIGQSLISIVTTGPCFRTMIQPIIISNCTINGCHNPVDKTHNLDFTTYDGIIPLVQPGDTATSILFQRINHVVVLSVAQRATIGQWILAGAPNSQCNNGLADCDTTDVHFSTYVKPTIANYCVGCHSFKDAGLADSLDFTSDSTIISVAQRGLLVYVIKHRFPFPNMPEWGPQLDSCTIAKITSWVNRGAPND